MRALLPSGEIVEADEIPREYRNQNYVLVWSDSRDIYVVTSKVGTVPIGD